MQGDFYLDLPTILVMPLYPVDSGLAYQGINPEIRLNGDVLIAKPDHLANVTAGYLMQKCGSLADQRTNLTNALDRLITGYEAH